MPALELAPCHKGLTLPGRSPLSVAVLLRSSQKRAAPRWGDRRVDDLLAVGAHPVIEENKRRVDAAPAVHQVGRIRQSSPHFLVGGMYDRN